MGAFKKSWRYVIFIKVGEHVNEIMAVAAHFFSEFLMVRFSYNQTKR